MVCSWSNGNLGRWIVIPDSVDGRVAVRFTHMDGDIDSLHTEDLNARMIGAVWGGLRFTRVALLLKAR
jgi:hypothetical protein